MKINKLMFALLAGAMFASCSDDLGNEPAPDNNTVGSTGYIGISIGMPAQGMSRGLNDNFDDGISSEYEVKSAALIFFIGDEANAQFYKAYTIGAGEWNSVTDNPNQITQNRIVTFPVDFANEATGDLWALAVINPGSVLTVGRGNTLTFGEQPFTGTIKDFLALQTSATLSSTGNFFMTNAPHSSVPGTIQKGGTAPSNGKFRVLAPVDKSRICATEQAAQALPAAAIFVERAVAKVEVDRSGLAVAEGAINFPSEDDSKINDVQWTLDNTEPSTFLVRNLDSDYNGTNVPYWAYYDTNSDRETLKAHYRFLGNSGFGHTFWPNTPDPEEHYRTYFGVDPHGNGIEEGENLVAAALTSLTLTGSNYPKYCYENTFDVEHMDYRNTTRAIIRVDFGGTGTGDLYTVGEDKKNVYEFKDAASYLTFAILNDPDAVAAWTAHFEENPDIHEGYSHEATTADLDYNATARTADGAWMKVGFTASATTGRLTVSSIVLKDGHGVELTELDNSAIIGRVNEQISIKYYASGRAYYAVRVRHFGNDLAPWTAPETTTNTTEDSYGKTAGVIGDQDIRNYLGRYGVLRNNWYVLNLGNINQMGEPIIGDLPLDGTPDDRVLKEESISCRINILSWAKRTQSDPL